MPGRRAPRKSAREVASRSERLRAASATRVVPVTGNADVKEVLVGGLVADSMWRLAEGEYGGDQIVQRPGQVVLGDQDSLLIDAKMVDRASRNRAVERQGSQGACDEILPRAGVAGRGGVNHLAPHGAVRADSGHDDPHQLSLSRSAAFQQADGDDGGLRTRPAGYPLYWLPKGGATTRCQRG